MYVCRSVVGSSTHDTNFQFSFDYVSLTCPLFSFTCCFIFVFVVVVVTNVAKSEYV